MAQSTFLDIILFWVPIFFLILLAAAFVVSRAALHRKQKLRSEQARKDQPGFSIEEPSDDLAQMSSDEMERAKLLGWVPPDVADRVEQNAHVDSSTSNEDENKKRAA